MSFRDAISSLKSAYRRMTPKHRLATIGPPPSTRIADSAKDAVSFSRRWVDRLEYHVEGRMHALDVPEHQVGMSDHKNHVEWRTFFPDEMTGGGNGPGSRINVDSGVMNLDLLVKDYNEHASKLWAASRLKDRIDAIIIHELSEAEAKTHAGGARFGTAD